MNKVDQYLDKVLFAANLAPEDHHRVRDELEDHLREILSIGNKHKLSEEETIIKIEEEFGKADELGRAIARAHGEFRTYLKHEVHSLKREIRYLPYSLCIASVLITFLGLFVFTYDKVESDALSPIIAQGHGAVIYKLSSDYQSGDVILYRTKSDSLFGIVKESETETGKFKVSRNNEEDRLIDLNQIVGRVFITFR